MAKTHTQCLLLKKGARTTSWIPSTKAVEGKVLKLKFNDEWEDGWVIEKVFSETRSSK